MYTYTKCICKGPHLLSERLPHVEASWNAIVSSSKYREIRNAILGKIVQREWIVKLSLNNLLLLGLATSLAIPAVAEDTGADTFKNKCAMCHGADGKANTPAGKAFKAVSLRDPMVVNMSDDELITVVKNGKNKMPIFKDKLTDDQIKAVVSYIRTLPD